MGSDGRVQTNEGVARETEEGFIEGLTIRDYYQVNIREEGGNYAGNYDVMMVMVVASSKLDSSLSTLEFLNEK